MNSHIAVLPDSMKKLLLEARDTLPHSLESNIEAAYKDVNRDCDPLAEAIINHINALRSVFNTVEYLLKTPPLKRLAGGVLHGALMLNLSFSRLCNTANNVQGIALNGYSVDESLCGYEDGGAILNAINASRVLNDVIEELRGAI